MIFCDYFASAVFWRENYEVEEKKDGSWVVDVGCVKGRRLRLTVATRDEGRELLTAARRAMKEARLSFSEYVRAALATA